VTAILGFPERLFRHTLDLQTDDVREFLLRRNIDPKNARKKSSACEAFRCSVPSRKDVRRKYFRSDPSRYRRIQRPLAIPPLDDRTLLVLRVTEEAAPDFAKLPVIY